MSQPDDLEAAPGDDPPLTRGDRVLRGIGPVLMTGLVVYLLFRLRGDTPWAEVAAVLLVGAAVGAVLAVALAGLRSAVPALVGALFAGMVVIGGVLDRDEWLGYYLVGLLLGACFAPVDIARRDARRRA